MTSAVRRDLFAEAPSWLLRRKRALLRGFGDSRTVSEAIESHDNNYTGIRFVLAASVIYYHAFGLTNVRGFWDYPSKWLYPTTSVGGLAVQCFFFLSGLFVTQSFCRDPYLLGFIAKRALRIWPALFTCLATTAFIGVIVSKPRRIFEYLAFSGWWDYILQNAHFNLTWDIEGVFSKHRFAAVNGPIHTLPLEAKMYVMLGVLAAVGMLRTQNRVRIGGLALLGVVLLLPLAGWSQNPLFDADYSWAAGCMFIAGIATYGWADYLRPALWQGAVLAVAALATKGSPHTLLFFSTVIWALLYLGQNGAFFRPKQDLSYGVYLYGWPCTQFVVSLGPKALNPYVLTLLAVALAMFCASLSWRFVEKPTMVLAHELSKARFGWTDLLKSKRLEECKRGFRVMRTLLILLAVGYAMRAVGHVLFNGALP
jgi:peptidoglycan/LPS O-acetylase OafA/YrhL